MDDERYVKYEKRLQDERKRLDSLSYLQLNEEFYNVFDRYPTNYENRFVIIKALLDVKGKEFRKQLRLDVHSKTNQSNNQSSKSPKKGIIRSTIDVVEPIVTSSPAKVYVRHQIPKICDKTGKSIVKFVKFMLDNQSKM